MRNNSVFVDMHIHSCHSDGTESVESICQRAVENGVGIISITDHNELAGTREALEIAPNYGLQALQGIELDSTYEGHRCHLLGYGFDLEDASFNRFVADNKMLLERTDEETLRRIAKEYPIDISAYQEYSCSHKDGGFKLIHFLVAQGAADNMETAISLMKRYKKRACFPKAEEVIQKIHHAGGVAILAHPGETFKITDGGNAETDRHLEEFRQFGIDGIECFYPKHKEIFERRLVDYCLLWDMYITVGGDYHGDFFRGTKQKIGCEFKRIKDLRLKNLLDIDC